MEREGERHEIPGTEEGIGAILVLAGGYSRRLGASKVWLPWDGSPLLIRVIERLSPLAGRRLVAARPGQALPLGAYERVDDELPGAGPLAGLAAGLCRVAEERAAARVAVSACDYPFADPRLLTALAASAPHGDVVLPRWEERSHPLQAVWRASVGDSCRSALRSGTRRLQDVISSIEGVVIEADRLGGVADPGRALLNLNDRSDLSRARSLA